LTHPKWWPIICLGIPSEPRDQPAR
jgi:hypothetical protein